MEGTHRAQRKGEESVYAGLVLERRGGVQLTRLPSPKTLLTILIFSIRNSEQPESLAQGLPWVLGLSPEALKGAPLTRRPGNQSRNAGAPSGLATLKRVSQGKPWAKFSCPFGAKNGPEHSLT